MKVHLLATVRKPELLPAALLVFRSLRVGFPTAQIGVWGNGLGPEPERAVAAAAMEVGAVYRNVPATSHDAWVEHLVWDSAGPFWICDTDVIFWKAVEGWVAEWERAGTMLAGRFEREFAEEWTGTTHVERLHTAVMWMNAGLVRGAMRAWMAKIPAPWGHSGQYPFVRQHFIPVRGKAPLFYDTCAGLWQAGLGERFTEAQDECFEHLHCATYVDLIKLKGMEAAHQAIYECPQIAKGIRVEQDDYYARRAALVKR